MSSDATARRTEASITTLRSELVSAPLTASRHVLLLSSTRRAPLMTATLMRITTALKLLRLPPLRLLALRAPPVELSRLGVVTASAAKRAVSLNTRTTHSVCLAALSAVEHERSHDDFSFTNLWVRTMHTHKAQV